MKIFINKDSVKFVYFFVAILNAHLVSAQVPDLANIPMCVDAVRAQIAQKQKSNESHFQRLKLMMTHGTYLERQIAKDFLEKLKPTESHVKKLSEQLEVIQNISELGQKAGTQYLEAKQDYFVQRVQAGGIQGRVSGGFTTLGDTYLPEQKGCLAADTQTAVFTPSTKTVSYKNLDSLQSGDFILSTTIEQKRRRATRLLCGTPRRN